VVDEEAESAQYDHLVSVVLAEVVVNCYQAMKVPVWSHWALSPPVDVETQVEVPNRCRCCEVAFCHFG
jgi:hypothetical protein